MPRVIVRVLAFLLLFVAAPLAAVPAAAGATAGAGTGAQSYDEVTEAVLVNVDDFWVRVFAAGGLDYASPSVVAVNGPLDTACGPADASNVAALYCGADRTIYYLPAFFLDAEQRIGNFAWHTVIAHEWGHHVQNLLGVERRPGKAFELQADCLAGAYAQDAETRGLLVPGDITEATEMSAAGGDPIWLPQDELGAHGTNDDRIKSFMRGNLDGVVGCALPFASTSLDGSVGGTTAPIAVGLFGLLPAGEEVPAGLVAIEEGGRSLEEIAATFPDPVDAAEKLAAWGFRENAYRNFVPAAVVGSVQVSLHRFGDAAAAAEALPYYAAGRAAVLGLSELRTGPLGDQSQAVTGAVAEGTEVTLYVRRTDLLVRVSAVVPTGDPVVIGRDVAKLVLAKPLVEPPGLVPGSPLGGLLPTADEVPFGLAPTEEGGRSEAEITASFPDPADAARRFVTWGWRENAYRYFEAPAGGGTAGGTVTLEVSLHRFASALGAAEAIPYYADGRAISVGLAEIPVAPIGEGAAAVGGETAAGSEATVYARRGAILVRVTAVAPAGDPMADAAAVAEAVLAQDFATTGSVGSVAPTPNPVADSGLADPRPLLAALATTPFSSDLIPVDAVGARVEDTSADAPEPAIGRIQVSIGGRSEEQSVLYWVYATEADALRGYEEMRRERLGSGFALTERSNLGEIAVDGVDDYDGDLAFTMAKIETVVVVGFVAGTDASDRDEVFDLAALLAEEGVAHLGRVAAELGSGSGA